MTSKQTTTDSTLALVSVLSCLSGVEKGLTHTVCAYLIPCSACRSQWKTRLHFLILHFFSLLASCLLNHTSHPFLFSLCSPTARLGLYLRAGFQRTAVRSSHISRLQDALSAAEGTSVPCRVQPLSTRGRQRHSHDHGPTH